MSQLFFINFKFFVCMVDEDREGESARKRGREDLSEGERICERKRSDGKSSQCKKKSW